MTAAGLTSRSCPACGAATADELIRVDPSFFCPVNPTIDPSKLKSCGLLDLPHLPIARCTCCGFVYVSELLSPRWRNVFWSQVYIPEKSREKIRRFAVRRHKSLLWYRLYTYKLAQAPEDTRTINVLDFGTGWGDFLAIARSEGVVGIGVEISSEKSRYARENGLDVRVTHDEISADSKFDIFFSDQVFEHLDDPRGVLNDLKRLLDRDFVGYIAVPDYNEERLKSTINAARKLCGHDKDLIPWDHVNYFSPQTLWDFIDGAGLEIFSIDSGCVLGRSEMTSTAAFFRYPMATTTGAQPTRPGGFTERLKRTVRTARSAWLNDPRSGE